MARILPKGPRMKIAARSLIAFVIGFSVFAGCDQPKPGNRRAADSIRAQQEADAERQRIEMLKAEIEIQRSINRGHQIQMDARRDYLKKAGL